MLTDLKRLHAMGFALHALKEKSKAPVESGWTKGPRKTWDEFERSMRPGRNVGVRLGSVSKVGDAFLHVIDVDIKTDSRDEKKNCYRALKEMLPDISECPRVVSGRGNGSAHFYFLSETVHRGRDLLKTDEWEISLMGEGRQVVLPGSTHPDSGRLYEWKGGQPLDPIEFPVMGVPDAESTALEKDEKKAGFKLSKVDLSELGLKPDQLAMIEGGEGVEDRSAAIFALCLAMARRGIDDDTIISVFTDRRFYLGKVAYEHRKTDSREAAGAWVRDYCLRKAKVEVEKTSFEIQIEALDGVESESDDEEWKQKLDLKRTKDAPPTLRPTFNNVRLILENVVSPALITLNEFSGDAVWNVNTPFQIKKGDKRSGKTEDEIRIKEWLIEAFQVDVGVNIIRDALIAIQLKNRFHPVKEYLESLEWDGTDRIAGAFKEYLGANHPEPYLSEISSKFFQAMIGRIYRPGMKFDYMVTFVGEQGIGKSSFGPILIGDEWFLDGLPDLRDKDAAMNIQGIWLCEVAELTAINRSANDSTKAFISRTSDKIRPPYGERRVDMPRTVVFYGSTNNYDFLTDPTGSRRFWVCDVRKLDFKRLKRDREQLLAEAYYRYHFERDRLWLGDKADRQQKMIAEEHRVEDESIMMRDKLHDWVGGKEYDGIDLNGFQMSELFEKGPFFGIQQNMVTKRAAGAVLRKMKFVKTQKKGRKVWKAPDGLL